MSDFVGGKNDGYGLTVWVCDSLMSGLKYTFWDFGKLQYRYSKKKQTRLWGIQSYKLHLLCSNWKNSKKKTLMGVYLKIVNTVLKKKIDV